ncbi:MAG: hypothetical protein ACREDR_28355 [Blastocatellia bacterium]
MTRVVQEGIKYQASDGWLLLAIILAAAGDRSASLARIVAFGDYMNHAIFTEAEMNTGLYRLSKGGYIKERKNGFGPTSKARNKYEAVAQKKSGLHDQMELLRLSIGATAWGSVEDGGAAENEPGYTGFSRERFSEAVSLARKLPRRTPRAKKRARYSVTGEPLVL